MSIYYISIFDFEKWEKDHRQEYSPKNFEEKSYGATESRGDLRKTYSDNKWTIHLSELVDIEINRDDYSAQYKNIPINTHSTIDLKHKGITLTNRFGYGLLWKKGGGRQIIDTKIGPLFSLEISGSSEYIKPYIFKKSPDWKKWGDILKKVVIDLEGVGRLSFSGSNLEDKTIEIGRLKIKIPEILNKGYVQSFKVFSKELDHTIEVRRNGTIEGSMYIDSLHNYIVNKGLIEE